MLWVIIGFGSLVFLTAMLIMAAVSLRGQWDDLGRRR